MAALSTYNVKDYGASGSTRQTTGNIAAGSAQLVVQGLTDFLVGHGISVANAGPLPSISAPAAPTVTPTGATGSTAYAYAVAALDGDGGETAASPVASISNGVASLSASDYNAVSWSAVTDAVAYAVYRTASAGTPNTTGLIGIVTSTSLNDTGLGLMSVPIGVAANAPSSALGDVLVSSIIGINGATITLAGSADSTVSGTPVTHDDTGAIAAAAAAAGGDGAVVFPAGIYNFSTVTISQAGQVWNGAGRELTTLACNSLGLNGIVLAANDVKITGFRFAVAVGVTKVSGNLLGMYNNSGGAAAANRFRGCYLEFDCTPGLGGFGGWGSSDVGLDDILVTGSLGGSALGFYACSRCTVARVAAEAGLSYVAGRPFIVGANNCSDMVVDTVIVPSLTVAATMTQSAAVVGMESSTGGAVRTVLAAAMSATAGAGSVDGVAVDNSGAGTPTHITVVGCIVDGATGAGIDIFDADDVTVQGNICSNCGGDGIDIFTSSHVQVLGNKVLANGNQGIHVAGSTQVLCANNEARLNANNGIAATEAGSSLVGDLIVTGNLCLDNNQAANTTATPYQACGISLQSGGNFVSIQGNLCSNEAGTTQLYGIGVFNTGWSQVQINDNNCVGNAQQNLYLSWGYTQQTVSVTDNLGFNPLGPRTPAASPFVSGTIYQNSDPVDWTIYQPAYATTSGTAGTLAVALGVSSTPPALYTKQIPGSSSSTAPDLCTVRVPSGWYFSFTATGVTLLDAAIEAE